MEDLGPSYGMEVERCDKPGRRQWRVTARRSPNEIISWPVERFYGRTRDKAVAKAQRWIDRQNRNTYRKEG